MRTAHAHILCVLSVETPVTADRGAKKAVNVSISVNLLLAARKSEIDLCVKIDCPNACLTIRHNHLGFESSRAAQGFRD